jgi:hypothetical protein
VLAVELSFRRITFGRYDKGLAMLEKCPAPFGYTNLKKPELPKKVWLTMLGLTLTNIVIASWR